MVSIHLRENEAGGLFHTVYKDHSREPKTARILKGNLGDCVHSLRVGADLLYQDWKPRSCRREETHI